jgi:hypothetical protein
VGQWFGVSVKQAWFMNKGNSFRELEVYQLAFKMQQKLFEHSKSWPRQEDYALTDQIRRSSRSIGANLAEAGSAP